MAARPAAPSTDGRGGERNGPAHPEHEAQSRCHHVVETREAAVAEQEAQFAPVLGVAVHQLAVVSLSRMRHVHLLDLLDDGAMVIFPWPGRSRPASPNALARSGSPRTWDSAAGQFCHVAGGHQPAGDSVDHHVHDAAGRRGHHRSACGHRLEHDRRAGVRPHRRHHHRARRSEQPDDVFVRQVSGPACPGREFPVGRHATGQPPGRAATQAAGMRPEEPVLPCPAVDLRRTAKGRPLGRRMSSRTIPSGMKLWMTRASRLALCKPVVRGNRDRLGNRATDCRVRVMRLARLRADQAFEVTVTRPLAGPYFSDAHERHRLGAGPSQR